MRFLAIAWTGVWTLAAASLALAFHESYWRWRDCFDDTGRCWTGEVVHHEQAAYLALPLGLSVLAALLGVLRLARRG